MTDTVPSGTATNHDHIPADVFNTAMMAAFPGLPDGMSLDQAGRRIAAALNAVTPLIEQRVRDQLRERIAADCAARADCYNHPEIWLPDSQSPDAIAARAMQQAWNTAARLIRDGQIPAEPASDDEDCER